MIVVSIAAERHVAVCYCAKVHARIDSEHFPREHRRLNKDDVSHREKRGQPSERFRARVSFLLGQFEEALDHDGVSAARPICRHKSLSTWQCAIRCEGKHRNYSKIPNLTDSNDFVNVVASGLWPVQFYAAL